MMPSYDQFWEPLPVPRLSHPILVLRSKCRARVINKLAARSAGCAECCSNAAIPRSLSLDTGHDPSPGQSQLMAPAQPPPPAPPVELQTKFLAPAPCAPTTQTRVYLDLELKGEEATQIWPFERIEYFSHEEIVLVVTWSAPCGWQGQARVEQCLWLGPGEAGTRGSGETGLNMEQWSRPGPGSGGRAGPAHDSVAQSALHKPLHTCYLLHRLLFQMEN